MKTVSTEFRTWIHSEHDKKSDKLRLMRALSSDEEDADMLKICRAYVAGALVDYATGNPAVKTVKPYGLKAARSTLAFKQVHSATLPSLWRRYIKPCALMRAC